MSITTIAIFVLCAVLAWTITGAVLKWARAVKLLDVPNARSSHVTPTPRGGGIGIVAGFLTGMFLLSIESPEFNRGMNLFWLAILLVAMVGFFDDRWPLKAGKRLVMHTIAALFIVHDLGATPPIYVFGIEVLLGWAGPALILLYFVWAVNFVNFMDGIDGIAALQLISISICGAILNSTLIGWNGAVLPLLLAACTFGFLIWNWPPARIFMGDAGSGFLGMTLGAFTVAYGYEFQTLFWGWLILQGCFMVDASTTLLRRVYRGEKAVEAHRNHAYQYAARRLKSHRQVTLVFAGITCLWLFPIAYLVASARLDGAIGLLVAYAPLVHLAYKFKAGARDLQEC